MKRTWSIGLFEHEQPSPKVWKAATRSLRDLDVSARSLLDASVPWMRIAGPLDDAAHARLAPLLVRFAELGARVHVSSRWVLDDDDHARADFVGIFGTDLGAGTVANEETALVDGSPCSCGGIDAVLREPVVVDEDHLDGPSADGALPGPGGWDAVQLIGFFVGVSARFAEVLRQHAGARLHLDPVLSKRTRQPSTRLFLLRPATRAVGICPVHTAAEEGSAPASLFCPGCGRGLQGAIRGLGHVRADAVGRAGVVSRHPTPGALPYVARAVDDAVRAAGLSGIVRHDAFMLCAHAPPSTGDG